ncbi:hypothetical protein DAMA08_010300 [Martiniozyma asiatica (nom. inval.)]|nr:hypothetical protein DAMA08_010300 [Martiniozyma asiatica]
MKLPVVLLTFLVTTLAKNLVHLPIIDEDKLAELSEPTIFDVSHLVKRSAKNIFDIDIVLEDSALVKRDAKNVAGLKLIFDDATLTKRDGKNVVDVNLFYDDLVKRDAKNIANIHLAIDEPLTKRDGCNMRVNIKDLELPDDPSEMEVTIGKETYSVSSISSDENDLNIVLKLSNPGKGFKLDLSSLTNTLENLQYELQTFLSGDKEVDFESFTPVMQSEADLASALTIREDVSLFASYLRDTSLYAKCATSDDEMNSASKDQLLVFAPSNNAIYALSKKPWETPIDVSSIEDSLEIDAAVQSNIKNFVESHIVQAKEVEGVIGKKEAVLKTVNGNSLIFKSSGSSWLVNGNGKWVTVEKVEILSNGALLTLDEALI